MAPIEIEYGRLIKVGDEETFVHDDSNEANVIGSDQRAKIKYNRGGRLKLDARTNTDDNGGIIEYQFVGADNPDETVIFAVAADQEATLTLGVGESIVKQFTNSKTKITIGFKASHVRPDSQ